MKQLAYDLNQIIAETHLSNSYEAMIDEWEDILLYTKGDRWLFTPTIMGIVIEFCKTHNLAFGVNTHQNCIYIKEIL